MKKRRLVQQVRLSNLSTEIYNTGSEVLTCRRARGRDVVVVVVVVVAAVIVPPGMISNALGEQRVLHCSVLPQHHFLLEPRRSQAPRSPVARVCIWMHE